MESVPTNDPQKRFEESPEALRPGNVLTYHAEDGGYFISQFGWRVETLPEGMEIKTKSFALVVGVAMPESTGKIVRKDGKILFIANDGFSKGFESKFFNGDVVEIVSLPDTQNETGA
ncbi:MAG TPA: hypothetical protein VEA92_00360 [Candidatus Paceibacterota bacterium]|nr:hypothetical protein [Candidatus Paceibacterota bacterium]